MIAGYRRTLSSSEVRHIFKSHGDIDREVARGQKPVQKADLASIRAIIEAASAVVLKGEPLGHKPQRLVYTAMLGPDAFEYVETLHPMRQVVAVKTLRNW